MDKTTLNFGNTATLKEERRKTVTKTYTDETDESETKSQSKAKLLKLLA
jgi:hypothetical protein